MEKSKKPPGDAADAKKQFEGFLPFYTNTFDRVFISVVILIGIHLLWLRFMEPALPIGGGDGDFAGDRLFCRAQGLSGLSSRNPPASTEAPDPSG